MLKGGHQVADIAVVYPIESAWVRFRPSRHMTTESPETVSLERTFRRVSEALYASRRDFTYVDARALEAARVEKGVLVHNGLRWRVIVLPGVDTLSMAAWRKIEGFVRSGGVVIAVGSKPKNSEKEFPSAAVQRISDFVLGAKDGLSVHAAGASGVGAFVPMGSEHLLAAVLDRLLEADVVVADASAPIRVTHRRAEGHELFFLINDGGDRWSGDVAVCAEGPGELWDPMSGKRVALAGPNGIRITLEPYSGVFLRFGKARTPARRKAASGGLPQLSLRPIKPTAVVHAAGTHVEASVKRAASPFTGAEDAWEALGIVKKSDVDTFMFAVMRFAQPVRVSDSDFLSFRVSVPQGQPSAPQLLVIVTDSRGVQYWAETGRALSVPGKDEIVLPLQAFSHAPFSTGPAGSLDWGSVAAINVGWGGHFGKEGDRIGFTVSAPVAGGVGRP